MSEEKKVVAVEAEVKDIINDVNDFSEASLKEITHNKGEE